MDSFQKRADKYFSAFCPHEAPTFSLGHVFASPGSLPSNGNAGGFSSHMCFSPAALH
jgi:hypothetical protein